jgi:hypothetical protein
MSFIYFRIFSGSVLWIFGFLFFFEPADLRLWYAELIASADCSSVGAWYPIIVLGSIPELFFFHSCSYQIRLLLFLSTNPHLVELITPRPSFCLEPMTKVPPKPFTFWVYGWGISYATSLNLLLNAEFWPRFIGSFFALGNLFLSDE